MKKSLLTIISILLLPLAIYLGITGEHIYSGIIFMISTILVLMDIMKYTNDFQFVVSLLVFLSWGIVVDTSYLGFPFMTLSVLFSLANSIVRLVFIKKFSYAKYKYFETITGLLAIMIAIIPFLIYDVVWFIAGQILMLNLKNPMNAIIVFLNNKEFAKRKNINSDDITGVEAPYFELKDQNNETTKLSDYKGERHLLLIFVRGDWCPYCHMMLRTYMKKKETFATKNILVMAIGPDPVGVNQKMVENLNLDYKVLSDKKMTTAQNYGIRLPEFSMPGATKHEEGMPLPASFLVDKDGIIRYTSSSKKIGEFLDPSLIFPVVEALSNEQ